MILIESYDADGRTSVYTQSCDGVQFKGEVVAELNELPVTPIIKAFHTRVAGGIGARIDVTIPHGGRLLMCHCAEDANGRIL